MTRIRTQLQNQHSETIGNDVNLLGLLIGVDGEPLGPATGSRTDITDPTGRLTREHSPFDVVAQTGDTAWMTNINPMNLNSARASATPPNVEASGTHYANPQVDKRWNPSQQGQEGFNFEITLPAALFTSVGWYRYRFEVAGEVTEFQIAIRG